MFSEINKKRFVVLIIILLLVTGAIISYFLIFKHPTPNTWITDDPLGIKYVNEDGEYISANWAKLDDNWYYFDAQGYAVTGNHEIGGFMYHFDDTGILQTGWTEIDLAKEYVTDEPAVLTGWQQIDGDTYYFGTNGVMVSGHVELDTAPDFIASTDTDASINAEQSNASSQKDTSSTTMYIFGDDGKLASGWQTDTRGDKYYVNQNGTLATGNINIDGELYLLDETGHSRTGWINENGDRYYCHTNGAATKGLTKLGDTFYTFDDKGKLITKDFLLEQLDALEPKNNDSTSNNKSSGNSSNNSGSAAEIVGIGGYTPDSNDISNLQKEIENLKCRTAGFVMINLYNGKGIAYNYEPTVYSASCIKGPYIASLVSYKPELLETKSRTFENIIMNSDNEMYSNTRKAYGREFFGNWCEEAHVSRDTSVYHYPQLNAIKLAKLWVQNYYFFNTDEMGMQIKDWYISPNASSIYNTLGTYSQDQQANGTTQNGSSSGSVLKSKGYRTESKAGWICEGKYRSTTDGGIIYPDGKAPYIIAIITDIPSNLSALDPLCLELNEVYEKTLD